MKKIILLISIILILSSCIIHDGKDSFIEIHNNTAHDVRLVFERTAILISKMDKYKIKVYGPSDYSDHIGERLDSIIFNNNLYIDIYGDIENEYYKRLSDPYSGGIWMGLDELGRYGSYTKITMDDYNKAIPIPVKE